MILILVCVVPILTILILVLSRQRPPLNFPPGPLSLPIIGGLYSLGMDPFMGSVKLWEKYGLIVGIDFASYRSVIINDYKLIKSALSNPAIQGHPDLLAWKTKYRVQNGRTAGMIFSEGQDYLDTHKFTLKKLKEFGFGSARMEDAILDQVDKIFQFFDSSSQVEGIETKNIFNTFTGNIIWSLVFARKMPNEDQVKEIVEVMDRLKEATGVRAAWLLFPWAVKIFPNFTGFTNFDSLHAHIFQFCQEIIENHKMDKCTVENDKDFVDLYLDEMDKETDPRFIFYGEFGEFNLSAIISDLIMGGVDTSAEAMTWALLIAIKYPKIQEKLYNEIEQVIGRGGSGVTIKSEHRQRLVYLDAFVRELMRFRPTVPWGAPHKVTMATQIGPYDLPTGTIVHPNFYAVAQDPRLWDDPMEFRPERFLTPDGQKLVTIEGFSPFSIGRRICPGSILALDEMFLILGNIFQNYEIRPIKGEENNEPSLSHTMSFVMTPLPFKFVAVRRDV